MKKTLVLIIVCFMFLMTVHSAFATWTTLYDEDAEVDAGVWYNTAGTSVTRDLATFYTGIGGFNVSSSNVNDMGWSWFNANVTDNSTINLTFNANPTASDPMYVTIGDKNACDGGVTELGGLSFESGNVLEFVGASIGTYSVGVWDTYELLYFHNGTNYIYNVSINNTLISNNTPAYGDGTAYTELGCIAVGGGGSPDQIYLDNLFIQKYSAGSGSSTNPANFTNPSPANNSHNNTQVTFNLSCDVGLKYFLYFDNSSTPTTLVIDNLTIGNYTTGVAKEEQYYTRAQCYNESSNVFSSNVTRTWFYDITEPSIVLNSKNAFNTNNYSNINQYNDLMPLNITFSDNIDLFAFQINITKDSTVYFNVSNESISGTSFTYTNSLNVSSWSSGTYNIEVMTSDSHTANKIPNYKITKKKSSITFKPSNDNNIKIETDSLSTINTYKLTDRYNFIVDFDDNMYRERLFHIKTDKCPLYYRENSEYKAHFVSYCENDGNWIDFEGTNSEYEVTKIDDYHFTILFYNLEPTITFRSIGGLNTLTVNYTWYKGSEAHNTPNAYQDNPFSLTLNLTFDNITMYDFNTYLVYNGTTYNVSESSGTGYKYFSKDLTAINETDDIQYYWNITVNQTDSSTINFNISDSHNIRDWTLTNCTSGNVTLFMEIFNESTPSSKLTSSVEIELEYWLINNTYSKTFNQELTGRSNYSICLDPQDETLYTDAYLKYSVVGGFTHRYYLVNQTLTNVSHNISLYNFDYTTGISDLKITARYKATYLYFNNVIGKLQRNYPAEGLWRTVQMDESGDAGLIFFNIKEEDTDYRIIFINRNNTVLKTTESMKFVCTSNICDVTFLLTPPSTSDSSLDLNLDWNYDNDTTNLTVTWDEATGTSTTLRVLVTKDTATGVSTLCSIEKTGASGIIVCDLSSYSGTAFLEISSSNSPWLLKQGSWLELAQTRIGMLVGVKEGAFWSFIITLTIIGATIMSPVAGIIGLVFALIVVSWLGLFTPITTTVLIIFSAIAIVISFKLRH